LAANNNNEEKRDVININIDNDIYEIEQILSELHGGDREKVNSTIQILRIFQLAKKVEDKSKGFDNIDDGYLFGKLIEDLREVNEIADDKKKIGSVIKENENPTRKTIKL